MRWAILFSALLIAACSQSQPEGSLPIRSVERATPEVSARGSLSPSAPVNLTYQVESSAVGQPQRIDIAIGTRLTSGTLLVEVAKQEGVSVIGETMQRIDLSAPDRPVTLQMQAIQLGAGEHFLVLLLTVETEMGPMSRSFRVDLTPAAGSGAQ